ncbi:MAG: hypothetical protein WAS33_11400 [Candidatus Promineifilaceae bacterium]
MNVQQAQRLLLLISLLLAGCLGLMTNWANPLFEPPDEYQHYQFVQHLVTNGTLPVQEPEGEISQSHQPPLYYWTGAWLVSQIDAAKMVPTRNPFWAYAEAGLVSQNNKRQFLPESTNQFPYEGGALVVHILRLWSLLLILLGVTAVWGISQHLWPKDPHKTALMLAFCGLNPMLLYLAGAVNNDSMIFMWGSVMLWLSLLALKTSFRWDLTVFIGLVGGLALLTKLNGLMLFVPWSLALLWLSWQKNSWRFLVSRFLAIGGIISLVAGWWFVRNFQVYGDPLALNIVLQVWGERLPASRTAALLWADVRYSWTNLWGRFGYGQVPLPPFVYITFGVLALIGLLAGVGQLLQKKWWRFLEKSETVKWIMLTVTLGVYVAALFYYIYRNPTGANGRYTFPALAALAALLTAGLFALKPLAKRPFLSIPITLALIGIALYSSVIYLPWVYAPPPLLTMAEVETRIDQPANLVWDDKIRLLGTAVSTPEATAGQPITVTACWEALAPVDKNYTLYIALLDYQFNSLGQIDTYPGLGTRPTAGWQPGTRFCDAYVVRVNDSLALPTVAVVDLGFYDLASGERLTAVIAPNQPAPTGLRQIKVNPTDPIRTPSPEETLAQFENGVSLVAYDWSVTETVVDRPITVQLTWHSSGPLPHSYIIFAHLLDANGNLLVQADRLPREGAYPTNFWGVDEQIVTEHTFIIPANAPAGPTQLNVGYYRLEDDSRLQRLNGAEQTSWVTLNGPEIRP